VQEVPKLVTLSFEPQKWFPRSLNVINAVKATEPAHNTVFNSSQSYNMPVVDFEWTVLQTIYCLMQAMKKDKKQSDLSTGSSS
jgi:hypothetical protein